VMFHPGREHDTVIGKRESVGELVDGLGRVLAEDDCVAARVRAHEPRNRVMRIVVGSGAETGLEAGTSMRSPIQRESADETAHDAAVLVVRSGKMRAHDGS
jgi:hypothetical protein